MTGSAPEPPGLEWIGRLELTGRKSVRLGDGPFGHRRLDFLGGEVLTGPDMNAVVTGGADHLLRTADTILTPQNRVTLMFDDGHAGDFQYTGRLIGPPEVIESILDRRPTDPTAYSVRISAWISTASPKYGFLNDKVIVGAGALGTTSAGNFGIIYQLFEVMH